MRLVILAHLALLLLITATALGAALADTISDGRAGVILLLGALNVGCMVLGADTLRVMEGPYAD